MLISTFQVPATDKRALIDIAPYLKNLKVSKVIKVETAYEYKGYESYWNVIVVFEPEVWPPPPTSIEYKEIKLKKALDNWVAEAKMNQNYPKARMVSLNMEYLMTSYNEILEDIKLIKSFAGVGEKKFVEHGQELYDLIKDAVTYTEENEQNDTQD